MLPNSFSFILFFLAVALAFFLTPKRCRYIPLAAANLIFYLSFSTAQIALLLANVLTSYLAGRALGGMNENLARGLKTCAGKEEKAKLRAAAKGKKRLVLAAALLINLGMLIAMKYLRLAFSFADSFVAPIGISFYTLTSVGYLVDLFRGKYAAEKNPVKLLCFLTLFLQLIQGPFLRYDAMRDALSGENFSYDRLRRGAMRMLWGYFKKLVVADRLGVYVASAIADPLSGNGAVSLLAILFYSLQIYADFSGYMDIVAGAGSILGIRLPENFDNPLRAVSVADFWRRWHMTLSAWFKDYVFYPISVCAPVAAAGRKLRRAGRQRLSILFPALCAMLIVWPLTGLWHGASWNFFLWGILNGLLMAASLLAEPFNKGALGRLGVTEASKGLNAFRVARTFTLLAFIRLLTITTDLSHTATVLCSLGSWAGFNPARLISYFPAGARDSMEIRYILPAAMLVIPMLLIERLGTQEELLNRFDALPLIGKYALSLSLLFSILLFGLIGNDLFAGFLYANF